MPESTLFCRTLGWIKTRAVRDTELVRMSSADLHNLATDIGVTEADLREVVPKVGDHSDLMDQMMRARGLDPLAVRRDFAGPAREMEITCARCGEARTCRLELKARSAASLCHSFCGNASAMDDLLAARP